MAALDCEEIIKKAIGHNMTDDEIEKFFEEGERLYKALQSRGEAAGLQVSQSQLPLFPSLHDQAKAVADAWAKKKELVAIVQKRNIYL